MPIIKLQSYKTEKILFSGLFGNIREGLEDAVRKNICLDYVDLAHANLMNANLDDIRMRHACLQGTNLIGANLSEAVLDGCDFRDSALHNACLCLSSLKGCDFEGASFGATDIAGAFLSHCRFSTFSAFSLKFREAETTYGCVFKTVDSVTCQISKPPVVIEGMDYPVIFMDHYIMINGYARPLHEWRHHSHNSIDERLIRFFNKKHKIFAAIVQEHNPVLASVMKTTKAA